MSNTRKCRRCSQDIAIEELVSPRPSAERDQEYGRIWAAWLAGYCSDECQTIHARDQVNRREGWWQALPSHFDLPYTMHGHALAIGLFAHEEAARLASEELLVIARNFQTRLTQAIGNLELWLELNRT